MNWNIFGHEWAVSLLRQHVKQERVRHAYLFTGPPGVGRRTLALRFAQALNCTQPPTPGDPCGICRACTQIERMQHPDLAVVQAEQRGGTLKVEQVRDLQRSLILAPYEARYRVALLLHFEEANQSAANALLKTLEEPASQVVLILTAISADLLLPTVVSRCEALRLRPVPLDQVRLGLQDRWGIPGAQAALLASIADGRPGYALYLYQEPGKSQQREHWLDEHTRLLSAGRVERFRFAEALAKDKEAARGLLFVWLSLWRDVLLRAAGAAVQSTNLDREAEIIGLAERVGSSQAYHFVAELEQTIQRLDQNVNPRLTLEILMLGLTRF